MARTPKSLAAELLAVIEDDEERLERIDNYIQGIQDEPYMPASADREYKLLAKRAVSNWMPLVINAPAQALYVDNFRPSRKVDNELSTPEWKHWQDSSLDAKQAAIYRAALGYGHSFTLTEKRKDGRVVTKGLSPLRTAALFEDAATDLAPVAALHITRQPKLEEPGKARLWTETHEYQVTFKTLSDDKSLTVEGKRAHGLKQNPVTRFAAAVDLEGRTVGVVEPMVPLQNRINQTIFDLLVAQTYASFKVRWVTGMAPPMQRQWFYRGDPVDAGPDTSDPDYIESDWTLVETPVPMDHNAKRFLFAKDKDTHFGSLDETPLDGFIQSVDMSIRHLAAISQTPPHHLLGQIANLSAEALQAAETALSRKVNEFQKGFGESWERVFRLAAELSGQAGADDFAGEVLWRDMENRSMAQSADALGKLADQLGIPRRGLWPRVPGVTANEIDQWNDMYDQEDIDGQLVDSLYKAVPPVGPSQTSPGEAPVPGDQAA